MNEQHIEHYIIPRRNPQEGPHDSYKGQTWRDMPGDGSTEKKMNFFFFRRDMYEPYEALTENRRAQYKGNS